MHMTLGFCVWDIPSALMLAASVAMLVIHDVRFKKHYKELEAELSARLARKAVENVA